jgi:nucleotide-binding universal stress UspA family protein
MAIVLVSMLVVTFLARKWGHDPFGWVFLAAVMGPIAIIGLLGTRHRDDDVARTAPPRRGAGGRPSVVIGCDGSEASARAAGYAAGSFSNSDIVLLVVEAHGAEPRTPDEERQQVDRVASQTASARSALSAKGVVPEVTVAYGNVGEEIVRYADREGVDAIVVGRRGAGLSRALLGSVSDHIVKNAKQPVVVVT